MSAVFRKANRYPRAVVALLAGVCAGLCGCGNKPLKPSIPKAERVALRQSIKQNGIGVLADGCVSVSTLSMFDGNNVTRTESLVVAHVIAARANLGLTTHGYQPRSIAIPAFCSAGAGDRMDLRTETNGKAEGEVTGPIFVAGVDGAARQAFGRLYTALAETVPRHRDVVVWWDIKRLREQIGRELLDAQTAQALSQALNARYVLVVSGDANTETTGSKIFGAIVSLGIGYGGAVSGAISGAAGGASVSRSTPYVSSSAGYSARGTSLTQPKHAVYSYIALALVDLSARQLIWVEKFIDSCMYGDPSCAYRTEDAGSMWRLLTFLH